MCRHVPRDRHLGSFYVKSYDFYNSKTFQLEFQRTFLLVGFYNTRSLSYILPLFFHVVTTYIVVFLQYIFISSCQVFCHLTRRYPRLCTFAYEYFILLGRDDDNASMPEQVKRPNTWRKMIFLFPIYLHS